MMLKKRDRYNVDKEHDCEMSIYRAIEAYTGQY